jgi:hypothetical protein
MGHCIYCGSTDQLSDEHIIPLGLGGRLVLPQSSCPACSAKTSKFERTCLRTMYGPLRLLYGLPSRRKNSRPTALPLKIKRTEDSEWEYVPVVQDRYPFLVIFPYFEAPGLMAGTDESEARGPVSDRLWIRGASPYHDFEQLLECLARELRVHSLMPEAKAEVPAFCSLLAKIAFSYAVANTGLSAPQSRLAQIALGENMNNCMHYIGSASTDEPARDALHEVSLGTHARTNSIIVRARLLAKLGSPTYFVVMPSAAAGAWPNSAFDSDAVQRNALHSAGQRGR